MRLIVRRDQNVRYTSVPSATTITAIGMIVPVSTGRYVYQKRSHGATDRIGDAPKTPIPANSKASMILARV